MYVITEVVTDHDAERTYDPTIRRTKTEAGARSVVEALIDRYFRSGWTIAADTYNRTGVAVMDYPEGNITVTIRATLVGGLDTPTATR